MRGFGAGQSSLGLDGVEHLLNIVQHVFVSETENEPSQPFQFRLSVVVVEVLVVAVMNGSVQFYDQPCLLAGEVREVAVDRVLTAELQSGEAASTQGLPQSFFGERFALTQIA